MTDNHTQTQDRTRWFRDARFGMFVHWGLYSVLGRHEWVMNRERIPIEEYQLLADQWHPKPGCAREWARLAKRAGMRYIVLTTKHHEGFCLFDTKTTDYNAVKRGPGRDLVAEFVEAARDEGLKVGLYFTLMDWYHPDGARCAYDEAARRRFIDYVHEQIHELCTNYGQVDILWYDMPWPLDSAGWEADKMNSMARRLQPGVLINNRSQQAGDFGTPEQQITPESGGRAWEACMTFNDSWGYTPIDRNWKSAWQVVSMLRQVAAGGGNLLLNIGPTPEGDVPEPCGSSLLEVGDWLNQCSPSIYDATDPMEQEWQITGAFTRKGSTAYFHCNRWPGSELSIGGLTNRVLDVHLMGGSPVPFEQHNGRLTIRGLPHEAPNPLATVIQIEVDGTPSQVLGAGIELVPGDTWRKTGM